MLLEHLLKVADQSRAQKTLSKRHLHHPPYMLALPRPHLDFHQRTGKLGTLPFALAQSPSQFTMNISGQ
ncbi:hypothetical protein IE81DRAFT_324657 [Ceraceosorus guamensis]|uniref:Uncharacterized protein n=1 Tax=Ceraceosorus guamensis TaxID=1522189 RepID=A0A316VWF4_9BASI|nr:hypothetical protein IE81DRAFT_324657 [Ceraceosorus guamensis]PWN41278.1 hypothetical protein IE81DRAFT_324657 [Ceraceosorus guamensis]